jgi:2-oxoglutarate ferredoxin oxidoreductase subunit alpha
MSKVYKVKIAGQAGQGIKSSGLTFSRFVVKSGFNIYNYFEYPSLIRGGHNVMQINISDGEVGGASKFCDFLVALNQESIHKHKNSMTEGSYVLFDSESKMKTDSLPPFVKLLPVPLNKLAHEAGGRELLINMVALGVIAQMMDGDIELLKRLVSEEYSDKPEILKADLIAIELGFKFAGENFTDHSSSFFKLKDGKDHQDKMILNGADSVALGAVASGLQFAAIYPMSPISGIMHNLAKFQKDFKFIFKQPEDEISAITMSIGASFAGARSMTATSGGGFCLMTEGLGLAGMTETPLVLILGMRPGPATGLPTWSSQSDLQFVLHAHQDEFPRIVLAAGDVTEAFYQTMEAFYLADKYQTPVVVLVDKNICEHEVSVAKFDTSAYRIDRGKIENNPNASYKRFALTSDGISPRALPGMGNFFIANSDEHDETGFSNEESDNRNKQMEKRMLKLETCKSTDLPKPDLYGPEISDLTIVSWGSNKGTILQALSNFSNVNYLHLTWLNPFPSEDVKNVLSKSKKIMIAECNFSAQLAQLILQNTGLDVKDKLLKYDGRPFFVEDLILEINKRLENSKGINL